MTTTTTQTETLTPTVGPAYDPAGKARKAAAIGRKINAIALFHGGLTSPAAKEAVKMQMRRFLSLYNDAYVGEQDAMMDAFNAALDELAVPTTARQSA